MTEATSTLALSEVSGSGDTTEESLQSLKEFSRLLEESDRFARLIEKTEKYSDMVPPYILEQVQADYREQRREVDQKLEAQKGGFRKAYQEHLSEKEVLEDICRKLRDRLKELRFRRVVGEVDEEDIQDEIRDLKSQLSESMERLDQMEEILDQYIIIGFDDLMQDEDSMEADERPSEQESIDEQAFETVEESAEEEEEMNAFASEEAEEETTEGDPVVASQDAAYAPNVYETAHPETGASAYPQGYLTILDGSRKGDRVPLIPTDIMLGSSPNTDVMLTDPGISESHARVSFKDRKYFLENLDILGRSYVNGIQSKVSELNHNDVIRMGNINLRVDFTPVGS